MKFFKGSRTTADSNYVLTEAGKKRADEFSAGGVVFEILATLRERGSCTMRELADETSSSTSKVSHVLKSLNRQGYIKSIGGED